MSSFCDANVDRKLENNVINTPIIFFFFFCVSSIVYLSVEAINMKYLSSVVLRDSFLMLNKLGNTRNLKIN
jgi:hypothetical protein